MDELVGKKVTYCSGSGKEYEATITAIPVNPKHGWTNLPTVSLEFRDERGKLVRKNRVVPVQADNKKRMVWYES